MPRSGIDHRRNRHATIHCEVIMNVLDTIIGSTKSKTNWTAIIVAVLTAVNEPVQQWIATHPSKAGAVAATLLIVLRAMTTTSLAEKA